jgi:biotin carboxylase
VESNNEYWLELDAALRTDFNITTGLKSDEIDKYKRKSVMKDYYRKAGIPVARCAPVTTLEAALDFLKDVGYPVVVKPDNGVGAIATYKLKNEEDTRAFFADPPHTPYLMEEYVPGEVTTYDGVCNSKGEVLFAASHITRNSIMDMVNEHVPTYYYVDKDVPADVERVGKATLAAFGASRRFFHLEFFRLTEDKPGLGKRGDLVALEVNMRPAGGYTPDMLNFSQSADVYQIWADMVAFDELRHHYDGPHSYCVYAGRRDETNYKLTLPQLEDACGNHAKLFTRMPDALAGTMGNQVAIACFDTLEEVDQFIQTAFEEQ